MGTYRGESAFEHLNVFRLFIILAVSVREMPIFVVKKAFLFL